MMSQAPDELAQLQAMLMRLQQENQALAADKESLAANNLALESELKVIDWAKRHIKAKSVAVSDGLACFNGLGDAEFFHFSVVTGGDAECVEIPYFKWVNTMISNVKNAMHGTFHAINLKHLPRYLAEFSYKFNRRYNLGNMIERLAFASLVTPPMPERLLKLAEQW